MDKIQNKILSWFAENQRDLPWRKTYDPYHVWISEVMLQQTQMERGVAYFKRWVKRFPDIGSVADGKEDEILKLWEGLGYYSRAHNIAKTAKILLKEYGANLPEDYQALLGLPGIGKYTAGAIMSLAFNQDYPIVDANVERLFARLFYIDSPIKGKSAQKKVWSKAKELIPAGQARQFNQALMELGALVCKPKRPMCRVCPIDSFCKADLENAADQLPVLAKGKSSIRIEMVTGVLVHDSKIFIQKRPANGVWANLWEFPGGRIEQGETPEQALVREYCEETEFEVGNLQKIAVVKHTYTIHNITLHGFYCQLHSSNPRPVLHAAQDYQWVIQERVKDFAFPAGHRKLIEIIGF